MGSGVGSGLAEAGAGVLLVSSSDSSSSVLSNIESEKICVIASDPEIF